jgi:cyclopropane-fatty-acyl-phospholipid synthase
MVSAERYVIAERVVEAGVPDPLVRLAIRANLATRLRRERRRGAGAQAAFVEELRRSPIATQPAKPNEQHYEVPSEFFELVLGPRLKYSSCLWVSDTRTLAEAEEAMLALTAERARIEDGMEILDLGCGWGSLTLRLAERFPNARITAVSNSRLQREWIETRAQSTIRVVTADVNELDLGRRFDRIISVEMFEHMRNYEALLARLAGHLDDDGLLFVHLFLPPRPRLPVPGWVDGEAVFHGRDDAVGRAAGGVPARPRARRAVARVRDALRPHGRGLARPHGRQP